ncbi:hypothetical protein F5B22DRAFT_317664 [Xylaria bambusicola]|uniref:uncharacterized protein n=1 Tax=Xylaria bambusicola TaxID=326684 RepID=UPI002007518C|nr:uncharacterized protein F5B22DRAFT_317664 [Xylaria bambusicola]KAI0509586.1 hypothetical protein F5B22DRAFT_317664 [Xylaria bambusicola]
MPLVPPTDAQFPTLAEGFEAWQAHALREGFAITKCNASNKIDGQYTRYTIKCTAATADHKSIATQRKASSARVGCQFKGVAKLYKYQDSWTFTVNYPHHNHLPSLSTPIHRQKQMTEQVRRIIQTGFDNLIPCRKIYKLVLALDPDTTITKNDVSNVISKIRLRKRGLHTDLTAK